MIDSNPTCTKALRAFLRAILGLVFLTIAARGRAHSINLNLQVAPRFNGAPLVYDSVTNITAADQRISVTRLDFLLSHLQLRRLDGSWVGQTNWFAYISGREGRTNALVPDVPADVYDRIRFHIGVAPEINHHSTASYAPDHPLNPDLNGLYWGWSGGYVFLALEGNWLDAKGKQTGFSYHIANDWELMTVELPATLDLANDANLRLAFNVDQIFSRPNPLTISSATATTHSRTNDPLAGQLHTNIENAFAVDALSSNNIVITSATNAANVLIAPHATLYAFSIPAYFPRPALPADNPLTEEGIALGRHLFSDTRLSVNNSQACVSCHKPFSAFTDGRAVAIGAEGRAGPRNTMSLFNLAWKSSFFWDGRAPSLRAQALQPIQNPVEMHDTLANVVAELGEDTDYPKMFADAFGTPQITANRIGRAIEQFLLVQTSHDSKFDRVLLGEAKFTPQEQRGFELFRTEYDPARKQFGADCFHCHGGALFQSQAFANNGLDATFTDLGRYKVTHRDGDQGKFAVPSLRNVELTGPYMHDGRFKTLDEVVEHYATGVKRSATLDPNLGKHPDGGVPLSAADKKALVAFLKTLTDERFHEGSGAAMAEGR